MNEIKLCDEKKCTQCSACVNICPKHCISWLETKSGANIPFIDTNKCVKCGLCQRACHQINVKDLNFVTPIYTYAAWSKRNEIRTSSSSGGVFSEIAKVILDKGGVVFGAAFNEELKVKHIKVETEEDLAKLRGSKYVQSDLGIIYTQVKAELNANRFVLFSGTPCQIAGLKSFLKKEYEYLYTLDLVCHGVPLQVAFDSYIKKIGIIPKVGDDFSFRKTDGWGYELSYNNTPIKIKNCYYLKAFSKNIMLNEPCYSCKYSTPKRVSDITIADFWGLGKKVAFKHSKRKGVNCVLINTVKGENLFRLSSNIFYEERTLKEAVEGNHNLHLVSPRPQYRNSFYDDCDILTKSELMHKYKLEPSIFDYLRYMKRRFFKLVLK